MHTRAAVVLFLIVGVPFASGCRRAAEIPDATHRQAVTAFYVALAALQTSQDAHARKELERVMQLVPDEAAAWANLGLLLLRQQQTEEAKPRLTKASELAPDNAAIVRLQALAASRSGSLDESIRHWRRAIELDRGRPEGAIRARPGSRATGRASQRGRGEAGAGIAGRTLVESRRRARVGAARGKAG